MESDAKGERIARLRQDAMEVVYATRRLLERAATTPRPTLGPDWCGDLGAAPERLRSALGAIDLGLRPPKMKWREGDPLEDFIIPTPDLFAWSITTIRDVLAACRERWDAEEERFRAEMRSYYEGFDSDGEERVIDGILWTEHLRRRGIEHPKRARREISPEESARLWEAVFVLEDELDRLTDERAEGWLVGTRSDLNEALGVSRNYSCYLENQELENELHLMRLEDKKFAIWIHNPARRSEAWRELRRLKGR
jgi:hypothetical protein